MADTPRDEWVTVDGLEFHYRDWGGSGQPVLLLHGLASTCHIWDMVAPLLAQDHAVIALDLRGHGESAKPTDGYDFASVSQDVLGVIKHLGRPTPVVVGHSWGGSVALDLAVRAPDSFQGMVWIDGGMIDVSARYSSVEDAKLEMSPPDFSGVKLESFIERVLDRHKTGGMAPGSHEVVMANFEILEDDTIKARLTRANHLRIIEALWDHHPTELYKQVQCPVLIMPARQQSNSGTQERGQRRFMSVEEAEQILPNSKTVWLENSIHDVPIQRPELVADILKSHLADGFFG
jgi:pimeloyl-ACP methyl ester carboxylesterase|tara:strand:+ start:777 stop:1649 length:873 start_codon:yes stop_codon:yes gene_type:complete